MLHGRLLIPLLVALVALPLAGCADSLDSDPGASSTEFRSIRLQTSFVRPEDAPEHHRDAWLPAGTTATEEMQFQVGVEDGTGFGSDWSVTEGCPGRRLPDCSDYAPRDVYRLPSPGGEDSSATYVFRSDGTAALAFPQNVTVLIGMDWKPYPAELEQQMRNPGECEDPRSRFRSLRVLQGDATTRTQYGDHPDTVVARGNATVEIGWTGVCAEHTSMS